MPDSPRSDSRGTKTPLVVALVAALVAGVMIVIPLLAGTGGSGEASSEPSPISSDAREQPREALEGEDDPLAALVRRDPDDPMAVGDVDAPVVMINYSEFQCPFCGKFARDTKPTLMEEYVEEGVLRIEWRDFPYLGQESTTAAHAARAAGEQGEFWAFHDAMFADQQPPNSGKVTEEYLAGIAEQIGLDVDRFREDMASEEVAQAVQRDFQEGQSIGVTGTPAFLVNGQPVMGAQPTETFTQLIEEAAAEAR